MKVLLLVCIASGLSVPAAAEILACEFENGISAEVQFTPQEYATTDDDAIVRVSPYPPIWDEPVNRKGFLSALSSAGAEVPHEDFDFYADPPDGKKEFDNGDIDFHITSNEVAGTHTLSIGAMLAKYETDYQGGATVHNQTFWTLEIDGKCEPKTEE